MSEEDLVQMLSTMFVQADQNGNGVLDKKEFKRLLLVRAHLHSRA